MTLNGFSGDSQPEAFLLYPDSWEPYLAHIPEAERGDLVAAYFAGMPRRDLQNASPVRLKREPNAA